MIFGFLAKKKPPVPLESGEIVELEFPAEDDTHTLYAKVHKISKKRNIFVHFVSRDKGDDLQIGAEGTLAALKAAEVIRFSTRLLHRKPEEGLFIFSPPENVHSSKLPRDPHRSRFQISLPLEYRAVASPHLQKGILTGFSWESVEFVANLAVPLATALSLEFRLPYREGPIRAKGKVVGSGPSPKNQRKYIAEVTLDEILPHDREDVLDYALLAGKAWKEVS